jgi:tetraacyldisaccharide 4'-kinase
MKAPVERLAREWWAGGLGLGGAALSAATAPASWAWAWAARRRARHFARCGGTRVEGLAVVSVGNLAVGGTGKTPVAAWVAGRLAAAGVPTWVLTGGTAADEALLHARWRPHLPVGSGRDRVATAQRARAAGARAGVLDDGFQHLRLVRDLDIVLLSADDPFPGPVLPRGPYREPPEALGRADAVVVTARAASAYMARALAEEARRFAPEAASAGVRLAPSRLQRLSAWASGRLGGDGAPGGRQGALELGESPVLAVCGVARPRAFAAAVRSVVEGPVELLALGDHHPYTAADVARMRDRAAGRPIVVSAKDAVKLARWREELGTAFVLDEELRWAWGEDELARVLDAVATEASGP